MLQYTHYFEVDINRGMAVAKRRRAVGLGDAFADRLIVTLSDGSAHVDLAGVEVSARVIRRDGKTVVVAGAVDNGSAVVTLDGECYAVDGSVVATVAVSYGNVRQSILRVEMEAV